MEASAFLTLEHLFHYLDATPSSRCIKEGQEVLNAKHIIACGQTERRGQEVDIFALSLQTSHLKERPHEIKGTLLVNNSVITINKLLCSCKAGNSGRCKHIAAVLLLCSRDNLLALPKLSSTDLHCYWTSRTAERQYTPAPLLQQECISKKLSPCKKSLSEDMCSEILEVYGTLLPDSAYSLHRNGRRKIIQQTEANVSYLESSEEIKAVIQNCAKPNLLDSLVIPLLENCCQEFYNKLVNVDITHIANITVNSKQWWYKERQFRITGSRCYSIYTYGLGDWENKSLKYFWPKSFKSKYTEYGVQNEGAAREAYKAQTRQKVFETGLIISQKQPWLAYTPDGIIFHEGKPSKLLEIKCPYSGKNLPATSFITDCKYLQLGDDGSLALKKKHMYYAQIQLGMTMLNIPECDFVLYSPYDKNYICINIKHDLMYSSNLIEKLHQNYFSNMLHYVCISNIENKAQ